MLIASEQIESGESTRGTPPSPPAVVITDVRMPFLSMVVFMVKWSLAAIPALLILTIVGMVIGLGALGIVRHAIAPPATGTSQSAGDSIVSAVRERQARRDSLRASVDSARSPALSNRSPSMSLEARAERAERRRLDSMYKDANEAMQAAARRESLYLAAQEQRRAEATKVP